MSIGTDADNRNFHQFPVYTGNFFFVGFLKSHDDIHVFFFLSSVCRTAMRRFSQGTGPT